MSIPCFVLAMAIVIWVMPLSIRNCLNSGTSAFTKVLSKEHVLENRLRDFNEEQVLHDGLWLEIVEQETAVPFVRVCAAVDTLHDLVEIGRSKVSWQRSSCSGRHLVDGQLE